MSRRQAATLIDDAYDHSPKLPSKHLACRIFSQHPTSFRIHSRCAHHRSHAKRKFAWRKQRWGSRLPWRAPQLSAEQRRIRAVTAEEYWIPSIRVAEAHLKGGGSAYVYELEFQETSGRLKGNAYHSLDVGMVWNHPHKQVADAASEAALGKQMHAAWSAFIRGETPAAPGLPAWPLYNEENRSTMIFGAKDSAESRVEQSPQAAELKLWNETL